MRRDRAGGFIIDRVSTASSPLLKTNRIETAFIQKWVPEARPLTCLELFAGAGGLALGTHQAGFQHLGLIEKDTFSVETLRDNSQAVLDLPSDSVIHDDACVIDYTAYSGKVDLLSGGPPCQPFSTAGSSKGAADERNMFPVFLDAIAIIRPRAVLIENVKGLCREVFSPYFDYILKRVEFPLSVPRENEDWRAHYERLRKTRPEEFNSAETYTARWQVVDTADYGVPQRRERVLVFAFRRDLGVQPFYLDPTHDKTALLIDQWVTKNYWTRHGVAALDHLGTSDKRRLETLRANLLIHDGTKPWLTVRDALKDLPAPVPRGCKPTIANHVQHPGARAYPPCHTGSPWDYPAKALKAGTHGTPGGENMLRDGRTVRYFTTREAARLQTFPDEWIFHGTWGACIRQLGNAVPVAVARLFAKTIHDRLIESRAKAEMNGACRSHSLLGGL